jgi:hypothetical protein
VIGSEGLVRVSGYTGTVSFEPPSGTEGQRVAVPWSNDDWSNLAAMIDFVARCRASHRTRPGPEWVPGTNVVLEVHR